MHIDKLDDTINEYNNTYHSTIKTKPVDSKSSTYFDSSKEVNDEKLKKLKILMCPGHLLLTILIWKKLLELFMKNNCKTNSNKL